MSALLLRQEDSWLHAIAVTHAMFLTFWRQMCMLLQSVFALFVFFVLYVDLIKLALLFRVGDGSTNAMYCAAVMAIATLVGVVVASATFPGEWRVRGTQICIALALAYPVTLYATSEPGSAIRIWLPLYATAVLAAGSFAAGIMGVARFPGSMALRPV